MFVRKKKNRSGTYSVMLIMGERVIGKNHPVSKMIKNFGVATDEEQLRKLLDMAEIYKKNLIASSPKAKMLKIGLDTDFQSCRSYNVGFSDVYGHAFSSIFSSVDIKTHLLKKLNDVVIMRIAEPCSKRRTAQIATDYGFSCQVDSIYKLMDQITEPVITQIKKIIYENTTQLLAEKKQTIDVLFYDLTTISFETNASDEIRDFGFSKDGKHQHVQIMLAVIVTKEGLPIDYEEFPGNSYEGHTLLPVIDKIKERYEIDKTVIVADAALMSTLNLQTLNSHGIQYIIAARLKNSTKTIKKEMLNFADYQVLCHSSEKKEGATDEVKSKMVTTDTGDTLFIYHSTKRARKDKYDREKALEKIKKHVNSTSKSKLVGCLKKTYVKVNKDCKIEVDEEKFALEAQYDGFFGIKTNIQNADAMDILDSYRGLWQVEQTFRIAKSNLAIRPVFHYSPHRIKAHFLICYMALSLIRTIEFKLKMNGLSIPCDQFSLLLNRMRKVQIVDNNKAIFELLEDPPPELIPIYKALGLEWHKKFQYISQL